jgi:hypothetical protein
MKKIKSNKIECVKCKEIIESKSTHDFVTCKCGACSVDGGTDYLRRNGKPCDFIERSTWGSKPNGTETYDKAFYNQFLSVPTSSKVHSIKPFLMSA